MLTGRRRAQRFPKIPPRHLPSKPPVTGIRGPAWLHAPPLPVAPPWLEGKQGVLWEPAGRGRGHRPPPRPRRLRGIASDGQVGSPHEPAGG